MSRVVTFSTRGLRRRLAVAVGGLAGTGLRAGMVALLPPGPGSWPWSTFAANVTGALLLGFILTRLQAAASRTTDSVPLLCTGLLGSYTTFSTLAVEVAQLAQADRVALGVAYGLASVAIGFAAAQAGIRLAEHRP